MSPVSKRARQSGSGGRPVGEVPCESSSGMWFWLRRLFAALGSRKPAGRASAAADNLGGTESPSDFPFFLTGLLLLVLSAWWHAGALGLMAQALRNSGGITLGFVATLVLFLARPVRLGLVLAVAAALLLGGAGWLPGDLAHYWPAAAVAALVAATACHRVERSLASAAALGLAMGGIYWLGLVYGGLLNFAFRGVAAAWGAMAGSLLGRTLRIGPSFAVPEIPLVAGVIGVFWLRLEGFSWWKVLIWSAVVVALHTTYLMGIAYCPELLANLPPPPPLPPLENYTPPPWSWATELRNFIPWNMPTLAAVFQLFALATLVAVTRRAYPASAIGLSGPPTGPGGWKREADLSAGPLVQVVQLIGGRGKFTLRGNVKAALLAETAVILTCGALFFPPLRGLEGLSVVVWKGGFLKAEVPDSYEELEMGSWGGLGMLLSAWGAKVQFSEELGAEELQQADVVIVIHPERPWPNDRVERLQRFLVSGGRILFIGGYHFRDEERKSNFDQLLENTGLRLPFQTVLAPGRSMAEGMGLAFHPAVFCPTAIVGRPGPGVGTQVKGTWPARPLVWARWAWADTGSDAVLTGVSRWEEGEPLGDLVLAAEAAVGKGRIIVWGHPEIVTDHNLLRHYPLLGRLLAYLAGAPSPLVDHFEEAIFVLSLGMVLFGFAALSARQVAEVAVLTVVGLVGVHQLSGMVQPELMPDGRRHFQWNNVVAIDLGHHNYGSLDPWSPEGLGAFSLQLLRCGYLPVGVEKITRQTLARAGILVAVAPQRPWNRSEQKVIEEFVSSGGVFIALIGADRSGAGRAFLRRLGLDPGRYPVPAGSSEVEPEPMGCIHTFYRPANVDYDAAVLFYAAWPIGCLPEEHLIRGKENLPVAAIRQLGRGHVVLIGDSDFILSANMEFIRQPVDGRTLNRAFWRWFLSWLTPQPDWLPPAAPERTTAAGQPKEISRPGLPEKSPRKN